MPVHQTSERLIAEIALPNGIAVASGKGGVGKTWFSISLAQALGMRKQRVLLVDADLGLANVDVQLGLNPEHDLADVVSGRLSTQQAVTGVQGGADCKGGFDVLAGRSGNAALSGLTARPLARLMEGLASQAKAYDRIVLDLGAGADALVLSLAMQAHTILIVVTDEPTSLTDAYAFIKRLAQSGRSDNTALIVNLACDPEGGLRTAETIKRAAREFLNVDVATAGVVPRDNGVKEAIRRQSPFMSRSPNSPAALAVHRVAEALTAAFPRPFGRAVGVPLQQR